MIASINENENIQKQTHKGKPGAESKEIKKRLLLTTSLWIHNLSKIRPDIFSILVFTVPISCFLTIFLDFTEDEGLLSSKKICCSLNLWRRLSMFIYSY